MANPITVAAPPTTADVAADLIAWMTAQSGVLTDSHAGSQVRTNAEATGSVVDMQGVIAQALAFQALVYAAFAAFGITPLPALSAVGVVTLTTGSGANPPPAVAVVSIGTGTLFSTIGGTQFEATQPAVLAVGASSVDVQVQAVTPGITGNVPAGSIVQIVSGIPYPLLVNNALPITGGIDAETPPQTLARFTAAVGALGLATPVSIANAVIGVTVSGTNEMVKYATVYEPWIAVSVSGAGFQVFVDNGSGAASPALLTAVQTLLNGNQAAGLDGYRPAGVPYSVNAVIPVDYTVTVGGTAILASLDAVIDANVTAALSIYQTGLQFGDPAELSQITAVVANAAAGMITNLSVTLLDSNLTVQNAIVPLGYERMIALNPTVDFA